LWDIRKHSSFQHHHQATSHPTPAPYHDPVWSTNSLPHRTGNFSSPHLWASTPLTRGHGLQSEKFMPIVQLNCKNKIINQKKFDKFTQRYVQLFSAHSGQPYAAIPTHTGGHVVTAAADNKLKLWDLLGLRVSFNDAYFFLFLQAYLSPPGVVYI
jgi:WD40 repeat protein